MVFVQKPLWVEQMESEQASIVPDLGELQPSCDWGPRGPSLPGPALCFRNNELSMQAQTPRVITLEVGERHSGSTSKVWTSKDSPQWDRWPLAAGSSTGFAVTYTPYIPWNTRAKGCWRDGSGYQTSIHQAHKFSIHSSLPPFFQWPNSSILCAS